MAATKPLTTKRNYNVFDYEERVLLEPSKHNWNIRLETQASWSIDTIVHPFDQRVDSFFASAPYVARVVIQSASSPFNTYPVNALDAIPPIGYIPGTSNAFPPGYLGPSGVWIAVYMRPIKDSSSPSRKNTKKDGIHEVLRLLVQQGFVTTPLGKNPKVYSTKMKWEIPRFEYYTTPQILDVHQLFFPTSGAAVSADAIQKAIVSPCGMLQNATAISHVLLGTTTSTLRRTMWIELSNMFGRYSLSHGVQYPLKKQPNQAPASWHQWIFPGTSISPLSCPMADQVTVHQVEWNGTSSQLVPVSQSPVKEFQDNNQGFSMAKTILRPHGMSYVGQFQTHVVNSHESCLAHVQVTDIVPTNLVRPIWQSLHVTVSGSYNDNIHLPPPTTKVQFEDSQQDHTALIVEAYLTPHSRLEIQWDYQAKFLPFEQFPGDPNRGIEVIPAMARITCEPPSSSSHVTTVLFSNTLLVLPPVPDMSMPFNVTSLTCSLYAYVFGSLIAFAVKKASEKIRYKLHPEEKPKSRVTQIKEKFRSKIEKLFRRKPTEPTDDQSHVTISEDSSDSKIVKEMEGDGEENDRKQILATHEKSE